MGKTVRWAGLVLLLLAMVVAGGCKKCDLKTEDLAGTWSFLWVTGTCTGGPDCATWVEGKVIIAGTVTVNNDGAVFLEDGSPSGLVLDADCSGDVSGIWPGVQYLQKLEGTGSDNRVDMTATLVNGGYTTTLELTMTR